MGQSSRPMICIVLICLLAVCESLPYVRTSIFESTYPHERKSYDDSSAYRRNGSHKLSHLGNQTSDTNSLPSLGDLLNFNITSSLLLRHKNAIDKVKLFVGKIFNYLFSPFVTVTQTTGQNSGKQRTTDLNVIQKVDFGNTNVNAKSTQQYTNFKDRPMALPKGDTSQIKSFIRDTLKMPTRSKTGRLLQGYKNHRQKRSFFFDYGFSFDSAFEDDPTDVVFGAHTSPCAHADRHYCFNGGTCLFVGALEIKTCRCKIGYTGIRCEMINQELLLALLSEEFFG